MIAALYGLALLTSDPAVATGSTPSAPSQTGVVAPASAKPEKEKKICKVDVNDSSSRLRKRVCLTQTEWERKEAGKETNDLKNIGAR
jgi:hypothetical protein